jgi:hypothetical protein
MKKKNKCPVCLSEDIEDVSYSKTIFIKKCNVLEAIPQDRVKFEAMCCNNCGVLFRLINK